MRYFLEDDTPLIRGTFRSAGTGRDGGIRGVTTIFSHEAPEFFSGDTPRELWRVAASLGLSSEYYGLLSQVSLQHLCILQYDFITVFLAAGAGPDGSGDGIWIIAYSSEGLSDGALLGIILTAGEAKVSALAGIGVPEGGTPNDEVVVASEGPVVQQEGGRLSAAGSRVRACVLHGIPEAVRRSRGEVSRTRPSLFVFSRFGGEHWVEWIPESCPYFPCHFASQRCDFCYCPFYPCGREDLGQWVESSAGGRVWNCSGCTLLHEPEVVSYLKKNPEATLNELQRVSKKGTA